MIVAPSPHLIELWDLIADAVERTWRFDEEELPRRATLSPDGRLLAVWTTGRTGARSDTLQVFDCVAGDRHASLSVPREEKPRLEFAPHKTHIAFTIDNDLWLWNVGSPTASHIAQAHGNTVTDLAYDPCSGVLATVRTDRLVKLWDPPRR